jgi:hypothetical protein
MQKMIVTLEMIELAKTYFIIKGGNVNADYVGPKGEYQKWYYVLHKEYSNKKARDWRINNRERDIIRSKIKGSEHRFLDKLKALRKVSGLLEPCCSVCGTKDVRILTINHLNGDGSKERANRVSRTYRNIRLGRDIHDLDVRCYNCNILYEYELGRIKLPLNWEELYGTRA